MKVLYTSAVNPGALAENIYPPLWPAYLTAFAEKTHGTGHCDFIYATGPVERLLDEHRPDILAVSSVTQNFGFAEKYAEAAAKRGIPVIVGGMHISLMPSALTMPMTVGCIGEGEQSFSELLSLFFEKRVFHVRDLNNIRGIAFHYGGRVVETPVRESRLPLDRFPHPARSLIGYRRRGHLYTARGCPYSCVFCSCTRFWGKVRYASPEYILEEITELVDHGARIVRFSDENFVANTGRLLRIAELIRDGKLHEKIRFSCWCRANDVTPETVATLKSMNVVSVKMGLESGSDRVLGYLKGGVTVAQNRRAVELLKDAKIQTNADFLFGAPDETEEEMEQTYRFIRKSRIDMFDIDIFSPLPGTPVWEYARKKGIVEDGMDWSRLNYKFNRTGKRAIHLSEKLSYEQLRRMHRRFRRLRAIRTLAALPRSPWLDELPGLIAGQIRRKISSALVNVESRIAGSAAVIRRAAAHQRERHETDRIQCHSQEQDLLHAKTGHPPRAPDRASQDDPYR